MWVNKMVLGVFLLATGSLVVFCGGEAPPPAAPAAEPAPSLMDVSALYATRCAPCHGEKRQGRYGSGGALTPESLAARSDAAIRKTISEGIPYTAMPDWRDKLSPEQIEALLHFIKYTSP